MAVFPPLLFTVTAVVLLCGSLTGEAGIDLLHITTTLCLNVIATLPLKHSQMLRKLFATSKWPIRTAPTSPSPGILWTATTPPATSVTSASTTGRDHIPALVLTLAQYLTQVAV